MVGQKNNMAGSGSNESQPDNWKKWQVIFAGIMVFIAIGTCAFAARSYIDFEVKDAKADVVRQLVQLKTETTGTYATKEAVSALSQSITRIEAEQSIQGSDIKEILRSMQRRGDKP